MLRRVMRAAGRAKKDESRSSDHQQKTHHRAGGDILAQHVESTMVRREQMGPATPPPQEVQSPGVSVIVSVADNTEAEWRAHDEAEVKAITATLASEDLEKRRQAQDASNWKRREMEQIQERIKASIELFEQEVGEGNGLQPGTDARYFRDRTDEIVHSLRLLGTQRAQVLEALDGWFTSHARGSRPVEADRSSTPTSQGSESGKDGAQPAGGALEGDVDGSFSSTASGIQDAVGTPRAAKAVTAYSKQIATDGKRLAELHTRMLADARETVLILSQKLADNDARYRGHLPPVEAAKLSEALTHSQQVVSQLRDELLASAKVQESTAKKLAVAEKAVRAKHSSEKLAVHALERSKAEWAEAAAKFELEIGRLEEALRAAQTDATAARRAGEDEANAIEQEWKTTVSRLQAELDALSSRAQAAEQSRDEAVASLERERALEAAAAAADGGHLNGAGVTVVVNSMGSELLAAERTASALQHANGELATKLAWLDGAEADLEAEKALVSDLRSRAEAAESSADRMRAFYEEAAAKSQALSRKLAAQEGEVVQLRGTAKKAEGRIAKLLAALKAEGDLRTTESTGVRALSAELPHVEDHATRLLDDVRSTREAADVAMAEARAGRDEAIDRVAHLEGALITAHADAVRDRERAVEEAAAAALLQAQEAAARHSKSSGDRIGSLEEEHAAMAVRLDATQGDLQRQRVRVAALREALADADGALRFVEQTSAEVAVHAEERSRDGLTRVRLAVKATAHAMLARAREAGVDEADLDTSGMGAPGPVGAQSALGEDGPTPDMVAAEVTNLEEVLAKTVARAVAKASTARAALAPHEQPEVRTTLEERAQASAPALGHGRGGEPSAPPEPLEQLGVDADDDDAQGALAAHAEALGTGVAEDARVAAASSPGPNTSPESARSAKPQLASAGVQFTIELTHATAQTSGLLPEHVVREVAGKRHRAGAR